MNDNTESRPVTEDEVELFQMFRRAGMLAIEGGLDAERIVSCLFLITKPKGCTQSKANQVISGRMRRKNTYPSGFSPSAHSQE